MLVSVDMRWWAGPLITAMLGVAVLYCGYTPVIGQIPLTRYRIAAYPISVEAPPMYWAHGLDQYPIYPYSHPATGHILLPLDILTGTRWTIIALWIVGHEPPGRTIP